jgi:hypothetical protein
MEKCSPNSDDNTISHEVSHLACEEDDAAYDELVKNITDLISQSSCVGSDTKDVIEQETHIFLQRIINSREPAKERVGLSPSLRHMKEER